MPENNKPCDLLPGFAGYSRLMEAMIVWFGLEGVGSIDLKMLMFTFCGLEQNFKVMVLAAYIEKCGLKDEYMNWLTEKYGDHDIEKDIDLIDYGDDSFSPYHFALKIKYLLDHDPSSEK